MKSKMYFNYITSTQKEREIQKSDIKRRKLKNIKKEILKNEEEEEKIQEIIIHTLENYFIVAESRVIHIENESRSIEIK